MFITILALLITIGQHNVTVARITTYNDLQLGYICDTDTIIVFWRPKCTPYPNCTEESKKARTIYEGRAWTFSKYGWRDTKIAVMRK